LTIDGQSEAREKTVPAAHEITSAPSPDRNASTAVGLDPARKAVFGNQAGLSSRRIVDQDGERQRPFLRCHGMTPAFLNF
jgi:hypothetical protein